MNFLSRLRKTSVERCEESYFPLDHWSVLEWAGAAAGECGEAANVAKKIRRDGPSRERKLDLADEIADTIIYLDLLAASEGINLENAIINKFNKTSMKIGSSKTL